MEELGNTAFDFNVIIPKPFNLSEQPKEHLDKIRDEVMDKVRTWENHMSGFFSEYMVYADSWRVKPRKTRSKKPNGLFNSKSGETHRAAETLGTFWLRSMTATDPYHEAVGEGLDELGNEIPQEALYAAERVITKQLRVSHYKEKLLRSLRSLAIFGTAIFEEPWVRIPYKNGQSWFEYTDFVFRSLLKVAYDTNVWDVNMSDFMATIDFPSKHMLRRWAKSQGEYWDLQKVEQHIKEADDGTGISQNSGNKSTGVWGRVNESKTRAGYTEIDDQYSELISYHGKINEENPVIAAYWEAEGRTDDPADFDFTAGVLNGQDIVRFHETQFGTWRSRFKVAHFKTFEDEGRGYGAGQIGRKLQREIDLSLSRANDTLLKGVYSMYLVGKFAGLKASQMGINPNGLIEVEDVDQVKPLPIDISTIAQALAMIAGNREEFRATVGAQTNLQAQATKAQSATESALLQTEAVRSASVHAEIIAETFLREHIEQMHFNNIEYLDEPIWVNATGEAKPGYFTRENLPRNIGIEIKIVTDKDSRPDRSANLLKGIEISTSIRQIVPESINVVRPLFEEWFRTIGVNPRLLSKPVPVQDQLMRAIQSAQRKGQFPALNNEVNGEVAGEEARNPNVAIQNTPVGPVPTSPLGAEATVGGL